MSIEKIRILFVVLQLEAGGSERVVLDLARNLDPLRFDVYVAAFNGGVLESSFRKACQDIFFLKKKKGFDITTMFQLSKIVKNFNIDVINAHHYLPCFYSFLGSCVFQQRRLIYTEHSVPEVLGVAQGKHGIILNLMLRYIDTVIGVSKEITNAFKKAYPKHEKTFRMVVNGVDIEKFQRKDKRKAVRQQFGFEPDHFVVGMVANFRSVKNHACLIRALEMIKYEVPDMRLLLVGTGFVGDSENTEDDVKKLALSFDLRDRVVFAGYQYDIPAMLSAMDCFCLPSFSEGLPVSVLEALAAGLVVIGSDVSGIREIIKHEISGFLFPSNDYGQLAKTLMRVIEIDVNISHDAVYRYEKSKWIQGMESIFTNSSYQDSD